MDRIYVECAIMYVTLSGGVIALGLWMDRMEQRSRKKPHRVTHWPERFCSGSVINLNDERARRDLGGNNAASNDEGTVERTRIDGRS